MVPDVDQVKLAAIDIEAESCPCHIRLVLHIFSPVLRKFRHRFRKAVKTLQLTFFRAVLRPCG